MAMVEMRIAGIVVDPGSEAWIVVLADRENEHYMPIWIGPVEAQAIVRKLRNKQPDRPLTHDLMYNLLETAGARVLRVEIHNLEDNTYFAHVVMGMDTGSVNVDSRPSDAMALAVRAGAGIFVAEEILLQAHSENLKKDIQAGERGESGEWDGWSELLANLPDDAFGKYKM
ncbi:MAG: hypothetical protein GMKNLPBB_02739 [Myxococcota bacterium]|nr:hypothetical protein [Myxococcota bacterium]